MEDLAAAMDMICKETADDSAEECSLESQPSLSVDPLTAALTMGALRKPRCTLLLALGSALVSHFLLQPPMAYPRTLRAIDDGRRSVL